MKKILLDEYRAMVAANSGLWDWMETVVAAYDAGWELRSTVSTERLCPLQAIEYSLADPGAVVCVIIAPGDKVCCGKPNTAEYNQGFVVQTSMLGYPGMGWRSGVLVKWENHQLDIISILDLRPGHENAWPTG